MWPFTQAKKETEIAKMDKKYYAVLEVSNLIAMNVSLSQILRDSVDLIVDKFGYIAAVIYMNVPAEGRIKSQTFTNKAINKIAAGLIPKSFDSLFIEYDKKENFIVQTVLNKTIIQNSQLSGFIVPVVSGTLAKVLQTISGTGHVISVPIIYKDECLGAIMFTKGRNIPFDDDIDKLKIYSQQIAIAIKNATLFDEKQLQIKELEGKNRDLSSLYNLTSQISQTLDPKEVAQRAVNSLPQDKIMVGAILTSFDPKTGNLPMIAYTRNQISSQVEKFVGGFDRFMSNINDEASKNNSFVKAALLDTEQYVTKLEELFSPPMPKVLVDPVIKMLGINAAVVYPVKTKGKIIGTIAYLLKDKDLNKVEESEKQIFQTYTNQIAIALENAVLYEESEEVKNNLTVALEEIKKRRNFEQDMIDVMGHELRTPMSIVRNALSMMELDLKTKGAVDLEHQKKYIEVGVDASRREVTLIETLLSATKSDGKGFQLILQQVDLLEVIDSALEAQKREAERKGLKLIYTKPTESINVYCDKTRVQEILDNFMSNAVKYTEKGSVEITVKKEGDFGWISVKDTGVGIPEDEIKKLGQKFYRVQQYSADNDPNDVNIIRPGGSGLGLFVAFSLIKVMDGKLDIQSKVSVGSTFSFAMPLYTNQKLQQVERKGESYFASDKPKE